MIFTLIVKDLEQNAKALAVFFLSALLLPLGFHMFSTSDQAGYGYLGVVFGYLAFGAPAMFAFWFVGQEKMKGTFRLLRMLPIEPRRIIGAKALGSLAICLAMVNLVALFIPWLAMKGGAGVAVPAGPLLLWLNAATVLFVSIDIAIFTVFEFKIASQVAYLGHGALAVLIMIGEKLLTRTGRSSEEVAARLVSANINYWGPLLVLAISCLAIHFAGRYFEMMEWGDLEEH